MAAVAFDTERSRRELPTMSSLVQQCCPPTQSATAGAKAARTALQQALREGLQQAIGDPGGGNDTQVTYVSPPSARDVRTQRIVRAADDYLRANPARPVYTEDLCTALGTSATKLHQAFDATFGISPHRYLKLRRMSMVHAALLSGCGPWRSVKAAALSHGFWHLGQFAQDYRALYGEAPSNTLARARQEAL
jgi:AraC family transcriptional regulator, ethanolamine operon transcriptional activator